MNPGQNLSADMVLDIAERLMMAARVPRRDSQQAGQEIAMLFQRLCKTPDEAEQLAAALMRQRWGVWSFERFEAAAEAAMRAILEPPPAPDSRKSYTCFTDSEYSALRAYAIRAGHFIEWTDSKQYPDLIAAFDDAERDAAIIAARNQSNREIVAEARAEWTASPVAQRGKYTMSDWAVAANVRAIIERKALAEAIAGLSTKTISAKKPEPTKAKK